MTAAWLSILVQPRRSIRAVLDTDLKRFTVPFALLTGGMSLFVQTAGPVLDDKEVPLWFFFPLAVVVGAMLRLAGLYLFGWLCRWVGSWMGGQAKSAEVRTAIAWVEVPTLGLFALWVLIFLISPVSLKSSPKLSETSVLSAALAFVFVAATFIAWIWSTVLACHTLGEVHKFSAWKGLLTLITPGFLVFFLVILIIIAFAMILPDEPTGLVPESAGVATQPPQSAPAAVQLLPEEPLLTSPPRTADVIGDAVAANLRGLATAMEEYRAKVGSYPAEPAALIKEGLLPKDPFEALLEKGDADGYLYRIEKSEAESYLIKAERVSEDGTGPRFVSVDQSGTIESKST